MLVLTRRPGESVLIGEGVTVTVLAVEGQRIRLGVSAPREVKVLRSEIIPLLAVKKGDPPVALAGGGLCNQPDE